METMTRETTCHLCVTHSALVTRVFEAAMAMGGVPARDVCSVSRRSAPFRGAGAGVDDISDEMEECFKNCDRKGFRAVWERFNQTLRGLTGGRPFVAYVPHLNKIIYQEIILHPDCAGYCFLEEGFTSMAWRDRRNARTSWAKILRSRIRSRRVGALYQFTRRMFDHSLPNYQSSFAISSRAFLGMPGRTDVASHLPPLADGSPPGKIYLILDAIYLFQGIRWQDYEDALVEALGGVSLPIGEVLVKFHFADGGAKEKFESLRFRLADMDIPTMRLLGPGFAVEENLTNTDLLVFAVTALGYYAALSGVRVLCFAGKIKGLSLPGLISSGKLPEDFAKVAGLDSE